MIEVREHVPGEDTADFIRAAEEIYRRDANWVPPLNKEIRDRLSPRGNPFFEHAQVTLFTAWRSGTLVGRCSAQIDHEHLRIHQDDAGFFGFFDTIEDPEVAQALLKAAEAWLQARGMKYMRGPYSLSINEELGTLVEGFDAPPMIMMPYHHPYQGSLIEEAGLVKAKDLLAWRYQAGDLPNRAKKAWEDVKAMPEVHIRKVDIRKLDRELPVMMDIFNDAWSGNWGFVPATPREVEKIAKDMKLILDENLAFIVEIHDRPAAICIAIPNLNAAIDDLHGRLFPLGALKLLWRLKVRKLDHARLMMLGIRRELRHVKRYGALSLAMYVELHKRGTAKGYTWGELSWTLEDNTPVNLGIRAMGGKVYKKYRLYEKPINGITS